MSGKQNNLFHQCTDCIRSRRSVRNVLEVIRLIKHQVKAYIVPSVTQVASKHDPYAVLVSCILSLRTKDKTTLEATKRLFQVAKTPAQMIQLKSQEIEKLIYPVGFYRTKAKTILEISERIVSEYAGKVPDTRDELLLFKGVGRKTANLVLGLGFLYPAICVDTHVHRISNRLGWIKTKNPEETEYALEKIIPKNKWIELNTILVAFGQNGCVPISPHCSVCSVRKYCKRVGVLQSR